MDDLVLSASMAGYAGCENDSSVAHPAVRFRRL